MDYIRKPQLSLRQLRLQINIRQRRVTDSVSGYKCSILGTIVKCRNFPNKLIANVLNILIWRKRIPPTGRAKQNLEESQNKSACQVRNFAELAPNIGFSEFDFYDLYRSTFEKSELGRIKKLLPLHAMAENFGLVSK